MRVVLKKDKESAKFGVVFRKGFAMNYSESLGCVEHPTQSNVWIRVKESEFDEVKNYVITGDNNFWYSTTGEVTKKGLIEAINEVKNGIKNNEFITDEDPSELHVFETAWSDTIEL